MKLTKKIDFQNVGELCRVLKAERITSERFFLDLDEKDCAHGLYASMKVEVESRGFVFIPDEDTRSHIMAAARWLVDPNGRPGLRLGGLYGNGKSTLALAMQRFVGFLTERENGYSQRQTFKFYTAKDICRLCAAAEKFKEQYDEYSRIRTEPMLIIDDLGEEPTEVMSYGMVHTPVIDIINSRYASRKLTVITTNLNAAELADKYGPRIDERFREMLTPIIFTNDSYRTSENHQIKPK